MEQKVQKKFIILGLFYGIPGIGKSTICQSLMKIPHNYCIKYISSDQIKKKLIQEYLINHPSSSYNDAFKETGFKLIDAFYDELNKLIQSCYENEFSVILIDKNQTSNTLKKLRMNIKLNLKINLIYLYIVPFIYPEDKRILLNKTENPISMNLLLSCIKRILKRKSHETMVSENILEKVSIVLQFIKLMHTESFNEKYLMRQGANYIIRLSFHNQMKIEVPKEIIQIMNSIIEKIEIKNLIPNLYDMQEELESFLEKVNPILNQIDEKFDMKESLQSLDNGFKAIFKKNGYNEFKDIEISFFNVTIDADNFNKLVKEFEKIEISKYEELKNILQEIKFNDMDNKDFINAFIKGKLDDVSLKMKEMSLTEKSNLNAFEMNTQIYKIYKILNIFTTKLIILGCKIDLLNNEDLFISLNNTHNLDFLAIKDYINTVFVGLSKNEHTAIHENYQVHKNNEYLEICLKDPIEIKINIIKQA